MPCYFIDTDDGHHLVVDDHGSDFADDLLASKLALAALGDMARDATPQSHRRSLRASIRDERGNVVYAASLTFEEEWLYP